MRGEFDKARTGAGTREWSEHSLNIGMGCVNGCLYCYARWMALFYRRISDRTEWCVERLTKQADVRRASQRDGVIMFPTTHDVTAFYLPHFVRVALLHLGKGNRLLVTSKPRVAVLRELLAVFAPYRDQVLFRFTLGSLREEDVRFWEPGASLPEERIQCLCEACAAGFQTSVSIEPMLAGRAEALRVIRAVYPWVTETVWVGKMVGLRQRLDAKSSVQMGAAVGIEALQCDGEIRRLVAVVNRLRWDKVRWKDSIRKVVEQ